MYKRLLATGLVGMILSGCASMSTNDYTGESCAALKSLTRQLESRAAYVPGLEAQPERVRYDEDGEVKTVFRREAGDFDRQRREEYQAMKLAYRANGCTG